MPGKCLLVMVSRSRSFWSGIEVLIGRRLILDMGFGPSIKIVLASDVGKVFLLSLQGELGR